ncbi:MAG: pentapeptide repeat-containing protein, partial [Pseudomonadota bacterium]
MMQDARKEATDGTVAMRREDFDAAIAQIGEISQNARTTWFGLLALLGFIGVVLMAHEDAHFFAAGVETQLPLIDLAVPTVAFFVAAPLILLAVHTYFHLQLVPLWDLLAETPQPPDAPPIDNHVYPWMLSHAALWWRRRCRDDGSSPPRALASIGALVSIAISWIAAPVALGALWWFSHTRHTIELSAWIGFCLIAATVLGMRTLVVASRLLAGQDRVRGHRLGIVPVSAAVLLSLVVALVSWERVEGGLLPPAPSADAAGDGAAQTAARQMRCGKPGPQLLEARRINRDAGPATVDTMRHLAVADLRDTDLTRRERDWKPWPLWQEDFEAEWRSREGIPRDRPLDARQTAMLRDESHQRFLARITSMAAPWLRTRDLRCARAAGVFLAGAHVNWGRADGADFRRARLQGADLRRTSFHGARFWIAQMQGTILWRATLVDASLVDAGLEGAVLQRADLSGSTLHKARLPGADMRGAILRGTDLRQTDMRGVNLTGATLRGVDLTGADMRGAVLSGASIVDARCAGADLRATTLDGATLDCDLDDGALDLAVGDAATKLP